MPNLEYIREGDWSGVQRLVDDLQTRLNFVPNPIYVGVTAGAPAFQNSWVNFDGNTPSTHRCAYFYKDRGRVYLGGVIKSGTTATVAFSLPAGFRPMPSGTSTVVQFVVSAQAAPAFMSINTTTGNVTPSDSATSAVTTFCFLDGISFASAS